MAICFRYLRQNEAAEDALQETFIHVFRHIQTFQNEGSFKAWISKIAVNNCLKALRKEYNVIQIDILSELSKGFEDATIVDKMTVDEVLKKLDLLPEQYRIVFNMAVIEGYQHKEIAELLKVTESTSRTILTRARKKIEILFLKNDTKFMINDRR